MPDTGAYNTVKSNPSIMYDTSAYVLEYRSYWLSISVVFILKDILFMSIFVSGGSKESKNGALDFMDADVFS